MHQETQAQQNELIKILDALPGKNLSKRGRELREDLIAATFAIDGGMPQKYFRELSIRAGRRFDLSCPSAPRRRKGVRRASRSASLTGPSVTKSATPPHIIAEMLYTAPEAAQHLRVSVKTLENWRGKRVGPVHAKVGRAVRYPGRDLLDYVKHALQAAT